MNEIWWTYWYFHAPNYVLALLIYTLLGRFLLGFVVPPDTKNYIFRWFRRWTDWVIRPVAVITPRVVPGFLLPPVAAFWLILLRLAFFVVMFLAGLTPRMASGQGQAVDPRTPALIVVLVLSALNGLQSPLLPIVLALVSVTWPLELLPRDVPWAFFQSSLLLSTATLLLGGVPAALYERIVRPAEDSQVSMYVWIVCVAVLTLPALRNMGLV